MAGAVARRQGRQHRVAGAHGTTGIGHGVATARWSLAPAVWTDSTRKRRVSALLHYRRKVPFCASSIVPGCTRSFWQVITVNERLASLEIGHSALRAEAATP